MGGLRSGRTPKSPSAHRLEATGRRRGAASSKSPPAPLAAAMPERPAGLDSDAAWLWDFLLADPAFAANVNRWDTPLLTTLCRVWSLVCRAQTEAAKQPLDRDARIALTQYVSTFDSLAARFGLSPSDRQRMRIETAKPDQPGIKARKR